MVKKAILAILFLLLTTKAYAQAGASCTTADRWPGTCSLITECNKANTNIVWDVTKCTKSITGGEYGCCGIKPGAPENSRPNLGQSCSTSASWPGTCTTNINCNQSDSDIAFDITECKVGGCCGTNPAAATKVCDFAGAQKETCTTCMGDGKHAWTAVGCIPTDPSLFIGQILGIAIGIGGGIAFLLILFGGFQILMSAGNPEKLNAGKELVTSAITGLIIIIFSLFILRLIGYTIFQIPGFG